MTMLSAMDRKRLHMISDRGGAISTLSRAIFVSPVSRTETKIFVTVMALAIMARARFGISRRYSMWKVCNQALGSANECTRLAGQR